MVVAGGNGEVQVKGGRKAIRRSDGRVIWKEAWAAAASRNRHPHPGTKVRDDLGHNSIALVALIGLLGGFGRRLRQKVRAIRKARLVAVVCRA